MMKRKLARFTALVAALLLACFCALALAACDDGGTTGGDTGGGSTITDNGGSSGSGSGGSKADNDGKSSTAKKRVEYSFRSNKHLYDHYRKHGIEMGFDSAQEYLDAANDVLNNSRVLHKKQDDGDTCYFLNSTGEFVVVSGDGYIRTYFIASRAYYDKQ